MSTVLQPAIVKPLPGRSPDMIRALRLQCPSCGHAMDGATSIEDASSIPCGTCGHLLTNRRGIWETVLPQRLAKYQRFIEEYETVRRLEGRGSCGGRYYLALPFKDMTGCNAWQWRIRSRSFRFIERRLLPILGYRFPGGLDALDIGAGNCWLSYRLALHGHRPVAVDLLVNDRDGLGAARHYLQFLPQGFARFRAEMDRMPFASGQFDLAVFNASLHYSEDYEKTLGECIRCLRRPGHILIIDSPHYHSRQSGEAMVKERHSAFERKYGFRSDGLGSREYLTPSDVEDLGRRYGVSWMVLHPWYGWKWAFRPLRAWLLRRREPAKFQILWGIVE